MSILREMDLSQMTVVDKVERHYLVTVDPPAESHWKKPLKG